MKTAAEYRAEAEHLRELARSVSDEIASAQIYALIEELERMARDLGNGSADE